MKFDLPFLQLQNNREIITGIERTALYLAEDNESMVSFTFDNFQDDSSFPISHDCKESTLQRLYIFTVQMGGPQRSALKFIYMQESQTF